MIYSRIKLADFSAEQPAPLPPELFGLADESLADLSAALDPVPDEFDGIGFWPVDEVTIAFDPRVQTKTGAFLLAPGKDTKRVTVTPELRDLTPEEIAALPQPPAVKTMKADVWRRATKPEAITIDTALNSLDVQMRRLWDDASYIDHSAPEFAMLLKAMTDAFGEERALELLAPSVDA